MNSNRSRYIGGGLLAVGLGIGAALSATPGVASADPSTDWLSSIDGLLGGAVPAAPSSLDIAISFDGFSLFQEGSATAATKTGEFALAIASGAGSDANATGGIFDSAIALDGGGALANKGAEFDSAFADGPNSTADAGMNGTGDFAFADGAHSTAEAGTGNLDSATVVGGLGSTEAENGNGDLASVVNTGSTEDVAIAGGTSPSLLGSNDIASVLGTDSTASAYDGDSNIAYVSDPFGAAGSPDSAVAGGGFSNDLAEVLFAHGNATADTANLLYDIVSLFGHFSGSF